MFGYRLASSMAPSEGFHLFSELQRARRNFVLESELHAVYLVTPLSVCYQMPDIDWFVFLKVWESLPKSMQRVGELVGVKEAFLMRAMRGPIRTDEKSMRIYKRYELYHILLHSYYTGKKMECNKSKDELKSSIQNLTTLFLTPSRHYLPRSHFTMA